jgi:hypothetical protein
MRYLFRSLEDADFNSQGRNVPRGFRSSREVPIGWILRTWSWNACCKCYALLFGRGLQVTIDGIEKCCIRGALFNEVEPQSLPGAVSDRIK